MSSCGIKDLISNVKVNKKNIAGNSNQEYILTVNVFRFQKREMLFWQGMAKRTS